MLCCGSCYVGQHGGQGLRVDNEYEWNQRVTPND